MGALKLTRKTWVIVSVVAALIVAAGAWALLGRQGTQDARTDGAPTDGTSATASDTRASGSTTGSPASSGTPNASGGTARPQGSGSSGGGTQTTKPVQPAPAGQPLKQITQAPESTMWAFKPDTYAEGTRIALQFEPYGIGPASLGESVVVRVNTARPLESGVKVPELAHRNVVLVLGSTQVSVGGTYEGVGVITLRGDRACIVLAEARATK